METVVAWMRVNPEVSIFGCSLVLGFVLWVWRMSVASIAADEVAKYRKVDHEWREGVDKRLDAVIGDVSEVKGYVKALLNGQPRR